MVIEDSVGMEEGLTFPFVAPVMVIERSMIVRWSPLIAPGDGHWRQYDCGAGCDSPHVVPGDGHWEENCCGMGLVSPLIAQGDGH